MYVPFHPSCSMHACISFHSCRRSSHPSESIRERQSLVRSAYQTLDPSSRVPFLLRSKVSLQGFAAHSLAQRSLYPRMRLSRPVSNSPRPGTPGFAAEQTFRTRRLLEHAVFLHGFHFVAGGVSEEVLEVLIFEGEGVAGDAFWKVLVWRSYWNREGERDTYHGRDKALL
jgi:hypothetical protein